MTRYSGLALLLFCALAWGGVIWALLQVVGR
jgi:hypothetical protein